MVQSNLKGKAVSIGYTGFAEVKNQQIKKKKKETKKKEWKEIRKEKTEPSWFGPRN